MSRLAAIPNPGHDAPSLHKAASAMRQNLEFITGQRSDKIQALPVNASITAIISKQNELIARLQGEATVGPVQFAPGIAAIPGMQYVPPAYADPKLLGAGGGVPAVDDASAITAPAGTEVPPMGAEYLVVFDKLTGQMATWNAATGTYTFAPNQADVETALQQVADALDQVQDLGADVELLAQSVSTGTNLLYNPAFEVDAGGWRFGLEQNAADDDGVFGRDLAGNDWRPVGMHTIGLNRSGSPLGVRDIDTNTELGRVPVEPGERYCVSAWLANHRCQTDVFVIFLNEALEAVSETHSPAITLSVQGGKNLAAWQRSFAFAVAPLTARWAFVGVRQYPVAGESNPYSWACRPMLERVVAAQVAPSIWSYSSAWVASQIKAVTTDTASNASAIQQVNARLETGGDINQAIVQVVAKASATDNKLLGSWAVTIDANGKLTGVKLLNDGTTSTLAIAADEVLIDGSVKAKSLDAGAVTAVKIAAGAVTADKISVASLAAIKTTTGDLSANRIDVVHSENANDWGWVRSAGKWWGDGANGWVMARHSDGRTFVEARGGSSRIWMSSWGDCGISFPKFSVDNAGNASFGGNLNAASGTLGTITAGLLRNPTDTTRINLNETGAGELLRVNGVTRIWGDGRTRWSNSIGTFYLRPRRPGYNAGSAWDAYFDALYIYRAYYDETWFLRRQSEVIGIIVDTGIPMDSILDAYTSAVVARVSGWSIWWNGASVQSTDKLMVRCTPAHRLPIHGSQTWGNVTLHLKLDMELAPGSPLITEGKERDIRLAELQVELIRLS